MELSIADCVSEPLSSVLSTGIHDSTDIISFYDDSWAKYKKRSELIVGAGKVNLSYFTENNQPDGVLRDSMKVETVRGKHSYQNMIDTLAEMVIRDYEQTDNMIAFVICTGFDKDRLEASIERHGYDTQKMPPIVHALKIPILLSQKKELFIMPRDYLYKQQVGDYANNIRSEQLRKGR